MKAGQMGLLAFLLETYSGPVYMFGRDMEYFYDFAKLGTAGSADHDRIHLMNVSRANVADANIKSYLHQEGLTEEKILSSENILLLDTAYVGTMPTAVKKLFSEKARQKMKIQLLVSKEPGIPSSRSFLVSLNPLVNDRPPLSLNSTISAYEFLPRVMDRSSKYDLIEGRWHPVGQNGVLRPDGSVSKEVALQHMQDMKADSLKPTFQDELRQKKSAGPTAH
ncbi:MAG: hypothetical protein H7326_06985 [Bdellovibrionaceae bacterium]|nr:hypothetical protein [Pseudobdellovibrionaceae bacterium]